MYLSNTVPHTRSLWKCATGLACLCLSPHTVSRELGYYQYSLIKFLYPFWQVTILCFLVCIFSWEAQLKRFPDHTKQWAEIPLLCPSCATTRQDSAVPAVQPASSPSYLQQAGPSCPFPVMELSCSLEGCDGWPVVCAVIYWLNIYILQCRYMLSPFLTFCLLVSSLIFMVIYRDLECNNLKSVWGRNGSSVY